MAGFERRWADGLIFEGWAPAGLVNRLDFRHLMFIIWASTQAHADQAPQFAVLLGKPALEAVDFVATETLITPWLLGSLLIMPLLPIKGSQAPNRQARRRCETITACKSQISNRGRRAFNVSARP